MRATFQFLISISTVAVLVLGSCTHDRIRSAGRTRHYVLHIPESVAGSERPAPLMLVFHGAGGSATGMRDHTGLDAEADRLGYIVAYPEGSGVYRSWESDQIADVQFVEDLIEKFRRETPVEMDRVYAVGFSSGGRFVQQLACHLGDRISAFASVSATMDQATAGACPPGRNISALFVLGTDDPSVGWDAATTPQPAQSLTAEETIGHWAGLNGCSLVPVVSELPGTMRSGARTERWEHSGCRASSSVMAYVLHGQDHGWPQMVGTPSLADTTTTSMVIAEFFESTNR